MAKGCKANFSFRQKMRLILPKRFPTKRLSLLLMTTNVLLSPSSGCSAHGSLPPCILTTVRSFPKSRSPKQSSCDETSSLLLNAPPSFLTFFKKSSSRSTHRKRCSLSFHVTPTWGKQQSP